MNLYKLVLLFAIALSLNVEAHDESHDWSTDKAAFASAEVDTKTYLLNPNQFIQPVIRSINDAEFRLKLEELSGMREVVIDGKTVRITERGSATGRELARQWLAQEYRALGFQVFQHAYNGGANFIAEKAGNSGKALIISSHMDSVGNAGANDDGVGTIAALLIAKSMKDLKNFHTIRMVAFDNEEQGLVGSRHFVPTLNPVTIIGDIQMEMMGFNSKKDGRFHVIDCDRAESAFLTTAIMQAIEGLGLPLTRVKACTDRSDHASFWQRKIPAVVLSENFFGGDSDVCYHKTCDKADNRLDLKYSSMIATGVAAAAAKLVLR